MKRKPFLKLQNKCNAKESGQKIRFKLNYYPTSKALQESPRSFTSPLHSVNACRSLVLLIYLPHDKIAAT